LTQKNFDKIGIKLKNEQNKNIKKISSVLTGFLANTGPFLANTGNILFKAKDNCENKTIKMIEENWQLFLCKEAPKTVFNQSFLVIVQSDPFLRFLSYTVFNYHHLIVIIIH